MSIKAMGDEKDAFYVVKKGDVFGIYRSFPDFRSDAAMDPSISVYKGYGLSKEAESYLVSHGLKQASFSIGASDVQDGLFGALSVCPFQDASGSNSSSAKQHVKIENFVKHCAPAPTCVGMSSSARQPVELDNFIEHCAQAPVCVGISATIKSTPKQVSTRLNSFTTCPQQNPIALKSYVGTPPVAHVTIQGKWKLKNENMAKLCKEALELKRQFTSFTIEHVPREFNSEADALANRAVMLRDGQVEKEVTGSRT